ncbi:MAG: hypothetical protein MUC88_17185 [Planctomycetes bacterium]|jgi:hypothetical protein|nr:hypothetical protein [Planctomycetota bacterium]
MKGRTSLIVTLLAAVTVLVLLAGPVTAQEQSRRGGLYGDWIVKSEFNGRQMESILSFSRNQEGNMTGQWIGFGGISELKDVKFEEGKLSFARVSQNRDGQASTSTFKGTITEGKLSGTVTSERGEYALTGERAPRLPRAAGIWDLKTKRQDQESTATLTLAVNKEGQLTGLWKTERGELAVSDVQYEQGKLSFKAKSTDPDRAYEASFEGTLERDALTGTMKSQRGESAVTGTRQGAALIGTWNLETTSERGTRPQRLEVNPDMSGRYGSWPIKKINFQNDTVDFVLAMQFGDQSFEMTFKGKIQDGKLTGELTSDRGSQKVTGAKVVRTSRRGN